MADTADTTPTSPVSPASPAVGHWRLDADRSSVRLRHRGMWGLVNVKGAFTRVEGDGEVRPDGSAHGNLAIDAASLDTGIRKRDTHLRGPDFFDVANHPRMVFTVTDASPEGSGAVRVNGVLTVIGHSHPMTFTARLDEAAKDAVTLTAEVVIDREDFGMTANPGGMMTGAATVSVVARFTRH
ncbi:YceI family protein [Streptomyces sp. NA02950]|uniref:YceI family protein n=1 Tax=Streptomyces sp. NA02950 TaxID=2742137 RepID=UPI001590EF28|nr:YceI family protein [Streptomyces sp. NA02950]QKV91107.1 YceI family protein [Streptomyces sp. NA02950]